MTEELSEPKSITWKIIVGFCLLVPAIVGLHTIYKSYFSKEEKIVGKAVFMNYTLPPYIASKVKNVNFYLSNEENEAIKKALSSNGSNENTLKVSNEINDLYRKKYKPYEEASSFLTFSHNFWSIEIANEGTRQADNVTIEFKGAGIYRIGDEETEKPNSFKDSIAIGTILPSRKVVVSIWIDYSPITDPIVTHTNGAEKIRIKQTEYEPTFWLWLIPYLLTAGFFGFLLLVLGIYLGQNNKVRIVSFNEQVSMAVAQQTISNTAIELEKGVSRGRKKKAKEPNHQGDKIDSSNPQTD